MPPLREPGSGEEHKGLDTPEGRARVSRSVRVTGYGVAFFDETPDGKVLSVLRAPSSLDEIRKISDDLNKFKADVISGVETPDAVGISLEEPEALSVYADMRITEADLISTD